VAYRLLPRTEMVPALAFALVPLLLLAAITLVQLNINAPQLRAGRAHILKSFQTLATVRAIDQAIQDAERGQRGFLVTGREDYLAPYLDGVGRLPDLVARLQRLTSANPEEQSHLLTLQSDLTTKTNELAATIAAMRTQGFAAARAIVNNDSGQRSMGAIRRDLMAIGELENALLAEQLASDAAIQDRLTATFVIATAISAAALLLGAAMLALANRRKAKFGRLLQATLDSVRESVATLDVAGRLQAWNAGFARMLGLSRDELRHGERVFERRSPLARALGEALAPSAQDGPGSRPVVSDYTDESGHIFELYRSRTAMGEQVATILDVTHQRRSEDALRQAQRIEALGQMTGGIAHDFNNLLTIFMGSLERLRRDLRDDTQALQRLELMDVAVRRGARLTQQLLAYARRQPLQPTIVNLGHLMTELMPLLRRAAGESIVVECISSDGLWNTTVDVSQFQSAVLNLTINSRDAMPQGGKLTIEVGNATLDDGYAVQHAEVRPGQYVMFAVTDTGTGMDPKTLAQSIDPFFTTKPIGQGTGLGLSQVFGFVKQSNGHLKLYSEVGQGTTVKLYLPRTLMGEPAQAVRVVPVHTGTGHETILAVDDDETVRITVAVMLEDLGYRVITARSGVEAEEILLRSPEIDLVFTDVVMPGPVNGRQLAERARRIKPGIKILFTSGYTENAIVHNGQLDPGLELLSKPYDVTLLAAKVRRVLDHEKA
jgi:signal transduction histidine kinase/ActR/RegA family two-component response regulator